MQYALRSAALSPRVRRLLPFLQWWPRVNRVSVRSDLIAGATGALMVLPQGVAFAAIAGMPPEYGLYGAIIPAIIAALFGSSWHLMAGPTTATSIVIFSTMTVVAKAGTPDYIQLVLTMSLLAGIFKLAIGAFRLGLLVNFISNTVVVGFTAGAGVLIATSQLHELLGLPSPPARGFIETVSFIFAHIGDIDWYSVSVGVVTLLFALLLKWRFPRIPYMIGALALGALYAYMLRFIPPFALKAHIATVPALPGPLPKFAPPRLTLDTLHKTISPAVVVGIVGIIEAMSIGRAIALRSGQRIDSNQELIGQGLANIAGAFFSSYAASGSLNRTGLNYEAGAKTPLSSIFSAGFLVLMLVAFAPLAAYLPIPAMAGVLLLVGWNLIDFEQVRKIFHVSRAETAVLAVTVVATLVEGLSSAIYLGVIVSLMLYLRRTSQPRVTRVPPDELEYAAFWRSIATDDVSKVDVIRIYGSIFFGAAEHVRTVLHDLQSRSPAHTHIVLDAAGVNFIDYSGAQVLGEEALRRRRLGGALHLYRANPGVLEVLERSGYLGDIGAQNIIAEAPERRGSD